MPITNGLTNYGDTEFSAYLRGAFAASMGYTQEALKRPVVGITYTASDYNSCHRLVPELIKAVERGVHSAGALPMVFPTMSLGESYLNPTSMYFRNLMAMETEELLRGQPMDAVVLIGGCDKTIPAQLMAALRVDVPSVILPVGPMSTGDYEGERLGACTDCRRYWGQYRGGEIDEPKIKNIEQQLATTAGTCPVMGTASTIACLMETLGMALPGAGTTPAVYGERLRIAERSGTLAAAMAQSGGPRPTEIVTQKSLRNALRMMLALSGSTNGIVHLAAIARRAGHHIDLAELNELSDETPVLVGLKPTGSFYMPDFHAAGGVSAVIRELQDDFDLTTPTVWGGTLADLLDDRWVDRKVIATRAEPIDPVGGLISLRGSLAPDGAILKRAAATESLFEHTGRAVVFTSLEDMALRVDDPDLDVNPEDILVLQNAGPVAAGMPEAGYLPIPKKLLQQGVTDMIRISDARMSGTAYGTIVLHVAPEAAIGGPLSKVRDGDLIRLSVKDKTIDVLTPGFEDREPVTADSLPHTGYGALYREQVLQAPEGCDFRVG